LVQIAARFPAREVSFRLAQRSSPARSVYPL
jgi:hypothetical protein